MAVLMACADDSNEVDDAESAQEAPEDGNGEDTEPTGTEDVDGDVDFVMAVPENESPDLSAEWAYDNQRSLEMGNVFEKLITRDPETNELSPQLATEWEMLDELTWRFQLRDDVVFHDGVEFNAESAAASLNHLWRDESRLRELGQPEPIEFEAVEEYVLHVNLVAPTPLLLGRMFQSQIFSPEQIGEDSYTTQPIGTGPYIWVDHRPGDFTLLERNDDWWGWDNPDDVVAGVPDQQWRSILFDVRPEQATRRAALEAGEVQFAFDVGTDGCEELGEDSCFAMVTNEIVDMRYDAQGSVLGDLRVRQALDLAFDRFTTVRELYGSEDLVTAQLIGQGGIGHDPDIEPREFDPDRARELLDEARADGVPVDDETIRIVTQSGRFERNDQLMQAIQFQWESELGISVDVDVLDPEQFNDVYRLPEEGTPDEVLGPERNAITLTTSSDAQMGDPQTYSASRYTCFGIQSTYCDPEWDERWEEATETSDPELRDELFRELFRERYELHVFTPVMRFPTYHGFADDSVDYRPRADTWVMIADFTPR